MGKIGKISKLGKNSRQVTNTEPVISGSMQLMLLVLISLNLLPLILQLASWFIALALLCLVFHLAVITKLVRRPSRIAKLMITLSGCVLLALTGRELGLLLGMLHLLSLAYLLKPFELNQVRDFYLLVILGILLLSCSFIFEHSLYFAIVVAAIATFNFSYLLRYFSQQQSWQFQLKTASLLLLQSLPLAIVLFIVFPKIPPFWQMPTVNTAKTGLSDKVKVGDIANLALSNALAFRVEFDSIVPPYQQMYWRALVLTDFDDRQWSQAKQRPGKTNVFNRQMLATLASGNKKLSYQVIAEPSNQHWLFGLDVALAEQGNSEIRQLTDYSLLSKQRVSKPFAYRVTSYLDRQLSLEVDDLSRYQQVDVGDNPQLSKYGQQLARQFAGDPSAIIQAVLGRFRQQNYRYTLTPPRLSNNSLDEFFFDTQAGFCEHYASSFTYLMRAAGIPARLVLGYLGGTYNQQGQYYSVYQRDAHAWSEVWLDGQGWLRVDPTAAIDPSRVERGFSQQLLLEQQQLAPGLNFARWFGVTWLELRMQLEAIDYQWTKLVINYSQQEQRNFLKHWLGNQLQLKTGLILVVSLVLVFAGLWLVQIWRKRSTTEVSIWLGYYKRAHQHLAALGIVREHQMSDLQFFAHLKQQQPLLIEHYQGLVHCFYQLQYQQVDPDAKAALIASMKQYLKKLQSISHD